jgi:hypothetical protein
VSKEIKQKKKKVFIVAGEGEYDHSKNIEKIKACKGKINYEKEDKGLVELCVQRRNEKVQRNAKEFHAQ